MALHTGPSTPTPATTAAAPTPPAPATPAGRRYRSPAVLLLAGGVLLAAGGAMHPQGSGGTLEDHLLSMFASPSWSLAHVVLLVGSLVSVAAFATARRLQVLGPRLRRWWAVAIAGWGFGALEMVPHLLAANEAHELAHHEATPVLDLHVVMQVVASPAVGLTGAALAVVVALASRSWAAWALAVPAVIGGLGSAAAGPLTVLSGDPAFAVLFPFQAGLALWLVGTGIRLLRR